MKTKENAKKDKPAESFIDEALLDYKLACLSREMSYQLRKEVLTGKAKFGIGGAGKELPLIALAKTFKKGDYWAGYYRDQTAMMAMGLLSPQQYFTALYGDAQNDEYSGGRQMNNHFSSAFVDKNGSWLKQKDQYNITSPLASLASNAPRALGLALASKAYKENDYLNEQTIFSRNGREVSFCIVGDATTSEGAFFETVNAAGVMQVPLAFIILDDGYGISVPSEYQTTKGDISKVLEGFRATEDENGLDIYTVKAWDYNDLVKVFKEGIDKIRNTSTPAIFHIKECTQPQGHSTSGSHQRYKSADRLQWEKDFDGLSKMRDWLINERGIDQAELTAVEKKCKQEVRAGRDEAWNMLAGPLKERRAELIEILTEIKQMAPGKIALEEALAMLEKQNIIDRSELLGLAESILFHFLHEDIEVLNLRSWIDLHRQGLKELYNTKLMLSGTKSALNVAWEAVEYEDDAPMVNAFQVLNAYFDQLLKRDPRVYAFGEDVGKIGDVNQAFAGLQEKYGESRVFDTGIREWTIVGQGIGMAMRGLRPIAEIQYLDYLAYAFSPLSDDLATLHYRSNGRQIAPAIIRTRGHRLEGIWHSGSPMGMLIHSMRGMHLLVPRNMTQAAGMYNTLMAAEDPAIVVECLNGYRKKEKMPSNLGTFTVPLGIPEVVLEGKDVTVVSYGSTLHLANEACKKLKDFGISAELIDVQSLLPFDLEHRILASIKKTSRVIFIDEDVPGGATAYMMQEVLEKQKAYFHLDAAPITLSAKAHRPAYGNDGDFTSKPSKEDIFRAIYNLVNEDHQI